MFSSFKHYTRVYTRAVIYSEARHNVSPVVWLYTFRMYRGGLLLEKNKKVDRKWSGWNNRVQENKSRVCIGR